MSGEWRNSAAKRQLECDLIKGDIPLDPRVMGPREIYHRRPIFKTFPYQQFRDRLRDMRKAIKDAGNNDRFVADNNRHFPTQTHDVKGKRRWGGSDAERLLDEDMLNGLHNTLKPKKLYLTRAEYQLYELQDFREQLNRRRISTVFKRMMAEKKRKDDVSATATIIPTTTTSTATATTAATAAEAAEGVKIDQAQPDPTACAPEVDVAASTTPTTEKTYSNVSTTEQVEQQ